MISTESHALFGDRDGDTVRFWVKPDPGHDLPPFVER
jgi:hypothetical protein